MSTDSLDTYGSEPPPHVRDYLFRLGQFVTGFAAIERLMFTALGVLSGAPFQIAQAVFSGTRVKGAIDLINRVMDARGLQGKIRGDLKRAFDQLGLINTIRNEILHYGTEFDETNPEWMVSNRHLAHKPDKISEVRISSAVLIDIMSDLDTIMTLVMHYQFVMQGEPGGLTDLYEEAARTPWRYKPDRQSPHPKERPESAQEPSNPPSSSPPKSKHPKLSSAQKRALRAKGEAS